MLLSCLALVQMTAQCASIHGITTGENDREGWVRVNGLLKGTVHGSVSGLQGDYILREIPSGKQTVLLSYLGYEICEVEMEFKEGETMERISGSRWTEGISTHPMVIITFHWLPG